MKFFTEEFYARFAMTDLRNGSDQYPNVRLQHSIDSNPLQTQIQPQKQWKEFNKALKDQIYS